MATNKRTLTPAFVLVLILAACGSSFWGELRFLATASGPFVQSLPVAQPLKDGLVVDFTDIATDSADLGDCVKAASDKSVKLVCVEAYQDEVEAIIARGHFGEANSPKLQTVLGLIRGIIASARIYYGAPSVSASAEPVTEESIKSQIEQLKREMRP